MYAAAAAGSLALMLFASAAAPPPAAAPGSVTAGVPQRASAFSERFAQAVEGWVAELAQQQAYASWRHAAWRREPLGPGQHGWIVLFSERNRTIGYMVVSEDDSGRLQLSEYGQGEYLP